MVETQTTDTLENVSVSVTNNFIFTTMNNFQDELIKKLLKDFREAEDRYNSWIGEEDSPYKKEAMAFNRAIMTQAKTTLFHIREMNAELTQ